MEFDDPNQLGEERLSISGYLSSSQIDVIRNKLKLESFSLNEQLSVLSLIDAFVRSNGKADSEYDALFDLIQKTSVLSSEHYSYPDNIKQTLPVVWAVLFFDFLVLTGVMSEKDLTVMRENAMAAMGGGGSTPKA